ncbi:hypothetical protein [[Clostridium] fimetarium]|uniref:Uncharacterized protein n=1 Tax=[Clostridium] fimetarium TaxID=99656 RepID=A0A1I0R375_9FIRM|nr:hypothetical protein [[Clostridium] fimetarium]SEW34835.1 hypothetical protein SAMN05421659_111125 [[Clostridium] fimetarium]
MVEIYFDKLYRYSRDEEHCFVAIPVKKGELKNLSKVTVLQNGKPVPMQGKVTSYYDDGSVRYMFLRFMANLPANAKTTLNCDFDSSEVSIYEGMKVCEIEDGFNVDCDGLSFQLKHNSSNIFEQLSDGNKIYLAEQFEGPYLIDGKGSLYEMAIGKWSIVESGPICSAFTAKGVNRSKNNNVEFELKITAYAKKPWVEVSYRIINTTYEPLKVASLVFYIKDNINSKISNQLVNLDMETSLDSTGCGDKITDNSNAEGPIFYTRGVGELDSIQQKAPVCDVRTCVGNSNYKTEFSIGMNGQEVNRYIDDQYLLKEANEHFAEVVYGTFFTDRTDSNGGVCATIFQAHQNYPKAVKADKDGIALMLVPENIGNVVMQSGMSREQRFLLHFHSANEPLKEIDNRSLIYQMPDRPFISPKVFKEADVMLDVFPEKLNQEVEIALINKGDTHSRSFGMLNWGDAPDPGYTTQGRGNGEQVWTNNEYDFPHACALMYARTGIRRFLDYTFVACSHWMDVDVCHFSDDPLRIGGQWEHTNGHVKNGIMVCSHEWVEGLFDYYHLSGDERGFETAIGIGENVLKLLDTPMFAHTGEANARETGWALRTLTALYVETHDKKWVKKCDWIVENFKIWEQDYGHWLAPYTDNTTIRVGFMISVAVGSLMRYHRAFPNDEIKQMIIRAVDDLIENCLLDNGLFYYKELPSLNRLGNNTLLLEALAIAYELTGETKYLNPGIKTFNNSVKLQVGNVGGKKEIFEDAIISAGGGTKAFAQGFIPLITYYKAISDNNIEF